MTGHRQDLAALYLRHRDAMRKVAASVLRGVGRAPEAEDAVADAVVSIMASPPGDIQNWEAFLVAAAKRKAIDRVRSAEVRHAATESSDGIRDRTDGTDLAEDVADDVDRQGRAAVARDCLSVLDSRHREAVLKIVALERPRSEVAADLGVSPGRVSQMVTRALTVLREELLRREGPQ